jgi:hypothetical protein
MQKLKIVVSRGANTTRIALAYDRIMRSGYIARTLRPRHGMPAHQPFG